MRVDRDAGPPTLIGRHATPHAGDLVVCTDGRLAEVAGYGTLADLLARPLPEIVDAVTSAVPTGGRSTRPLPPVDPAGEVWAAGVTYRRSREARGEEAHDADIYDRVYDAARPELFFKSVGWRVAGPDDAVAVRSDARLTVPEPELAAVVNSDGEVVGFTVCNDMTARDLEAENPLYLPQAKSYTGSCALGPWIRPAWEIDDPYDLTIDAGVVRDGVVVWEASTSTARLHRPIHELVEWLMKDQEFPFGAVLSTGTGLVPDLDFSLVPGDEVSVRIDQIGTLRNPVVGTAQLRRATTELHT